MATALVDTLERLRDDLEISISVFGKFHSTSFASKQLTAKVAFEERDVMADGTRRNVQLTCSLGYASIPCGRLERAERIERWKMKRHLRNQSSRTTQYTFETTQSQKRWTSHCGRGPDFDFFNGFRAILLRIAAPPHVKCSRYGSKSMRKICRRGHSEPIFGRSKG
jgi:hypothetical protein